eukprot:Lankesteria_metandrocarpae@DN2743_c0_g1_i1.p1
MKGGLTKNRSLHMDITEFEVVGRATPTSTNPVPKVFRMRINARNAVNARSKFWYFMKRVNKVTKTRGEILETTMVPEKNTTAVKNYGIWLRYDSREGTHNMYREYRDVAATGAVHQMYNQMAGSHKARGDVVKVMRIIDIPNKLCVRSSVTSFHSKKLRYPFVGTLPLLPRNKRSVFTKRKPTLFR